MSVVNNNLPVLDLPIWEQQTPAAAGASATGVVNATDPRGNNRFIYQLFNATNFWRFDTYACTWQQLANPTGGTVGAGTCMIFDPGYGTTAKGSLWAIIASAGTPVFYNYDIGTNTWSAAKTVTGLPATIGTDADMCKPDPAYDMNGQDNYTNRNAVQLSSNASLGATTLAVNALPAAMAANTILNFGTSSAPITVMVTTAAAASATSLTVAAIPSALTSGANAYWCNVIYFVGNAATALLAYSISGNTWSTATGAIPVAVGAGNGLHWLPGYDSDKLILVKGGASAVIYQYSMSTTTWSSALAYVPATETYTTGTHSIPRINPLVTGGPSNSSAMNNRLLIQLNATGKIYEFDPVALTLLPLATQWMATEGAAIVGNRLNYIVSSGVEFIYYQLHTSALFLRVGLNSGF
jgi:hypothetical protein